MADEKNDSGHSQLRLEQIYLKGLLFDVHKTADASEQASPPTGEVNIGNVVGELGDNRYEVVLDIKINAKDRESGESRYRFELRQAGIFTLENITEPEINRILNIYCPNVLFPYARQRVSSTIQEGGFPGLLLAPVNFEALYREQVAKAGQSEAEPEDTEKTGH